MNPIHELDTPKYPLGNILNMTSHHIAIGTTWDQELVMIGRAVGVKQWRSLYRIEWRLLHPEFPAWRLKYARLEVVFGTKNNFYGLLNLYTPLRAV